MSEKSVNDAVSFGERVAGSQAFVDLFRDGMALVEETAAYLDGPGRQESKRLERAGALAYATESMRLTTRLMQLASWLLLHRAVKEGEMSLAQASKEKAKVKLSAGEHNDEQNIKLLPERLRALIERPRRCKRRCAGSMPPCTPLPRGVHRQSGRAADRPAQGRLRARSDQKRHVRSRYKQKAPAWRGLAVRERLERYFLADARKLLLEPREPPAAVQ